MTQPKAAQLPGISLTTFNDIQRKTLDLLLHAGLEGKAESPRAADRQVIIGILQRLAVSRRGVALLQR